MYQEVMETEYSDEQLVKQIREGNRHSFGRLVVKYQTAVFGLTYRWTRNVSDIQDLSQETFLQAYRKLDQLKNPAKYGSWLRGIVKNSCRMWARGNKSRNITDDFLLTDSHHIRDFNSPPPEAELLRKEVKRTVAQLCDLLPQSLRDSARLHYVTGLNSKEIANKLIANNLTGMPVVKGDEVIGLVTEADLIMQKAKLHMPMYIQLLDSALYLEDAAEVEEDLSKMLGLTAKEVMTDQVVTIEADDTVENLATLIEEHHINPIPVTKINKLVGIASRADIVKLLARE